MTLPTVPPGEWYRVTPIDDGITLVEEPYVSPLLAANIWHVRGEDRDLVVDSGLGIVPLRDHLPWMFERDPVLVLSHAHLDHMGGAHEFGDCRVHVAELDDVRRPGPASLVESTLLRLLGIDGADATDALLLDALPEQDFDPAAYDVNPVPHVRPLQEGDQVDLGDRALTVLHLPGHTPGSINLYDQQSGVLFTGDVVYDEGLIDNCRGSDVGDYRRSMERLIDLDVSRAYPGHDRILSREDVRRVASDYLSATQR